MEAVVDKTVFGGLWGRRESELGEQSSPKSQGPKKSPKFKVPRSSLSEPPTEISK